MDVVCHQDIGVNGQAVLERRFNQRVAEERVVSLDSKDGLPVVAALDDVLRVWPGMTYRGRRAMGCSGQDKNRPHLGQIIVSDPIYPVTPFIRSANGRPHLSKTKPRLRKKTGFVSSPRAS